MKRFSSLNLSARWLWIPPVLLGLGAVVLLSLFSKDVVQDGVSETETRVELVSAEWKDVAPKAVGYGTAKPARIWSCVVEVSGTVTETHPDLRSGIRVTSGDMLVQIDQRDYQSRSKQRDADLASATAKVEELDKGRAADEKSLEIEKRLLALAEKEAKRLQQLAQSRAASRSELDRAESDLLRQRQAVQKLENALSLYPAQTASASAGVELAKARLEEAQRDIDRTCIVAPFDGVLSGVTIERDQVVSVGSKLFEVHDTDRIEIQAEFSPSKILPLLSDSSNSESSYSEAGVATSALMVAIEAGQLEAAITARSGRAVVHWEGQPVRLSGSIDPKTRTIGIVISVDNSVKSGHPVIFESESVPQTFTQDEATIDLPDGVEVGPLSGVKLYPGVFCEVALTPKSSGRAIVIPSSAVDQGAVCVAREEEGSLRLYRQPVTVAYEFGAKVVIADGLDPNDQVAVRPPVPMIDGMRVFPSQPSDRPGGPDATLASDVEP